MHRNKDYTNILNNINTIKIELMGLKLEREKLLTIHDSEWRKVKEARRKNQPIDKTEEIIEISKSIGNVTYRINKLISALANYHDHKDVMKLAIEYLDSEIERNKGILNNRVIVRDKVRKGLTSYIYPDGTVTSNPDEDNEYINKKTEQIERLTKFKEIIIKQMNTKAPEKVKVKIELEDDIEMEEDIPNCMPEL